MAVVAELAVVQVAVPELVQAEGPVGEPVEGQELGAEAELPPLEKRPRSPG